MSLRSIKAEFAVISDLPDFGVVDLRSFLLRRGGFGFDFGESNWARSDIFYFTIHQSA